MAEDEDWNDMSAAERHWDVLPPTLQAGFAAGLAKLGISVAQFLRASNKASAAIASNPDAFMKELGLTSNLMGNSRAAGERYLPSDSAVIEAAGRARPATDEVDRYIQDRYPNRE